MALALAESLLYASAKLYDEQITIAVRPNTLNYDERAATVRAGISEPNPHRQSKPKLSAQRTAIL